MEYLLRKILKIIEASTIPDEEKVMNKIDKIKLAIEREDIEMKQLEQLEQQTEQERQLIQQKQDKNYAKLEIQHIEYLTASTSFNELKYDNPVWFTQFGQPKIQPQPKPDAVKPATGNSSFAPKRLFNSITKLFKFNNNTNNTNNMKGEYSEVKEKYINLDDYDKYSQISYDSNFSNSNSSISSQPVVLLKPLVNIANNRYLSYSFIKNLTYENGFSIITRPPLRDVMSRTTKSQVNYIETKQMTSGGIVTNSTPNTYYSADTNMFINKIEKGTRNTTTRVNKLKAQWAKQTEQNTIQKVYEWEYKFEELNKINDNIRKIAQNKQEIINETDKLIKAILNIRKTYNSKISTQQKAIQAKEHYEALVKKIPELEEINQKQLLKNQDIYESRDRMISNYKNQARRAVQEKINKYKEMKHETLKKFAELRQKQNQFNNKKNAIFSAIRQKKQNVYNMKNAFYANKNAMHEKFDNITRHYKWKIAKLHEDLKENKRIRERVQQDLNHAKGKFC
jgi:hypothetical protein